MNHFPPPGQMLHPPMSQSPAEPSPNLFPQPFLHPGNVNEQALWIQMQRQREQQAALLQLYYVQQFPGLGMGMDSGMQAMNMNILSNHLSTAFAPVATAFAPSSLNGLNLQSAQPCPPASLLSNLPVQHQIPPYLSQLRNLQSSLPLSNPNSFPHVPPTESQPNFSSGNAQRSQSPECTPSSCESEADARQDSLAAPAPDEFTGVDDLILAKALHLYDSADQAISSLNGARNHASQAWQTYYTSNRSTVDKLVNNLYSSRESNASRPTPMNNTSCKPAAGVLGVPTREPFPSTKLIPHSGGFKYTEEDDEYFIRYVLWSFSQDVDIPKMSVCRGLSEKAPHHSVVSWQSYWWSRAKDIERVRQLFKDGNPPEGVTSFNITTFRLPRGQTEVAPTILSSRTRPAANRTKRTVVCQPDWSSTSESSESSDGREEEIMQRVSTYRNPISYTRLDMQAVVKYLADNPGPRSGVHWDAFSISRPTHTGKAWAEYYRRNQPKIDRKVRRLVKRRKNLNVVSPACRRVALKDKDTPRVKSPSPSQPPESHLRQNILSPAGVSEPLDAIMSQRPSVPFSTAQNPAQLATVSETTQMSTLGVPSDVELWKTERESLAATKRKSSEELIERDAKRPR